MNIPVGLAIISLTFSTSAGVNSPALPKVLKTERGQRHLPLVGVNLGNFADQVAESSSDTSDDSQSEDYFVLSIDICVLDS